MIWHIFKKDWKLLWPVALLVAGLLWLMAAVLVLAFRWRNPQLAAMLQVLAPLAYLGVAFLVTLVIHQDPIPGVRQDWLARPIRRRDLLLAKLLFVILVAHGAMLAADLFQGLANGFALRPSIAAALARNVTVLLSLTLPLVALASFTRTLAETTVWIVMGMLAASGLQILFSGLLRNGPGPGRMIDPSAFTGVDWVGQWLRLAILLLGAASLVSLQYFRRKTLAARWLAGFVAALLLLSEIIPLASGFCRSKAPLACSWSGPGGNGCLRSRRGPRATPSGTGFE